MYFIFHTETHWLCISYNLYRILCVAHIFRFTFFRFIYVSVWMSRNVKRFSIGNQTNTTHTQNVYVSNVLIFLITTTIWEVIKSNTAIGCTHAFWFTSKCCWFCFISDLISCNNFALGKYLKHAKKESTITFVWVCCPVTNWCLKVNSMARYTHSHIRWLVLMMKKIQWLIKILPTTFFHSMEFNTLDRIQWMNEYMKCNQDLLTCTRIPHTTRNY